MNAFTNIMVSLDTKIETLCRHTEPPFTHITMDASLLTILSRYPLKNSVEEDEEPTTHFLRGYVLDVLSLIVQFLEPQIKKKLEITTPHTGLWNTFAHTPQLKRIAALLPKKQRDFTHADSPVEFTCQEVQTNLFQNKVNITRQFYGHNPRTNHFSVEFHFEAKQSVHDLAQKYIDQIEQALQSDSIKSFLLQLREIKIKRIEQINEKRKRNNKLLSKKGENSWHKLKNEHPLFKCPKLKQMLLLFILMISPL